MYGDSTNKHRCEILYVLGTPCLDRASHVAKVFELVEHKLVCQELVPLSNHFAETRNSAWMCQHTPLNVEE